ncbi:hypothetical protein [Gilvimarinus chinensis]|uniref:hypothetical protein n=1 Tax=Gilvimarinus chinensis TaxID=396005 RepID=UPI0012F91A60|nr:hypothetical protein [Gilvimarinus chinensis]
MDKLALILVSITFAIFVGYGIPFICSAACSWIERGKKPVRRRRLVTFALSIACIGFIFDQAYRIDRMWVEVDASVVTVWAKMSQTFSMILFSMGLLGSLMIAVYAAWCILGNRPIIR